MATYRKFVFVCTGSDCKRNGCKSFLKEVKNLVKMDSHKGKYKIVKTKCMDFCKSGPIAVYNNEVIKNGSIEELRGKF
ncbi:NAD(P)H-dependent oxidoreductase subunit E [Negadavirga shengliensis]|uniref:NAD(P)H-dependent oxidoreductase subunit E n=1 Tax=Negadavirga shengliensis TaxID=1389218 RepID=A0ABV9T1N6_9BACT